MDLSFSNALYCGKLLDSCVRSIFSSLDAELISLSEKKNRCPALCHGTSPTLEDSCYVSSLFHVENFPFFLKMF